MILEKTTGKPFETASLSAEMEATEKQLANNGDR